MAEAPRRLPAPVAHDGPMTADPAFYDCGVIPDLEMCEFDVMLVHDVDFVTVDGVAQNFSPTAELGLVEHRTGFSRDLPYRMDEGERLRALFSYRRDDPLEVVGGSLFVNYTVQGTEYRLEIPVGAE